MWAELRVENVAVLAWVVRVEIVLTQIIFVYKLYYLHIDLFVVSILSLQVQFLNHACEA